MKRDLLLTDKPHETASAADPPDRLGAAISPRAARLAAGIERVGRWTRRARWPLMLGAALFCVYLPVLSLSYLFMDDYIQLHGPRPYDDTVRFFVSLGRPIVGGYLMLCRFFIHELGSNMLCHLLGVVGVMLLGTTTYRWLRRNEIAPPDAALPSFLIGALPSMQVYMAWITAGSFAYAAWLAVWALLVFDPQRPADAPPRAFSGWPRLAGAVALMVAAQMIYQPAAMYLWSMALAGMLAGWRQTPRQAFRRGVAYLGLGGLSLAAYWVSLKVVFAATGISPSGRARIATLGEIPGKLWWFVSEPLKNSLSLWRPHASRELSLLVAVVIFAGLIVKFRLLRRAAGTPATSATEDSWSGAWAVCLAGMIGVMIPLSYLFNLVVAENWASYRTIFALAASVAVLAYVAIDALGAWAGREGQAVLRRLVLGGCAVGAVLSVHGNTFNRMVFPQTVEYRFLGYQLKTAGLDEKTAIHMIRPSYGGGLCARVSYDEFGLPSSAASWVPVPMIRKALREMGLRPEQFKITHGTADEPVPAGQAVAVIDMRELVLLREPTSR